VVSFKAVLRADPTGSGTFVLVPKDVSDRLGLKGRPKIQAVIAGHCYRGSLMPARQGFCLGVLKSIQESAGVKRGDRVTVEVGVDTAPRVVEPPADLARALARDPAAALVWERLSYTNKKEIARNLEDAKKPETRERRLAAAIERLSAT
jgi:hypothetical protein